MLRLGELLSGACMYYTARTSLLYAGMMVAPVQGIHVCSVGYWVMQWSKTGPGKLKKVCGNTSRCETTTLLAEHIYLVPEVAVVVVTMH